MSGARGNRLTIFDTTLRDGEQAPGFSLRIDEKLKLARQLRTLGVDIIEAGFPIASDADAEAVRMISTHVTGPVIAADDQQFLARRGVPPRRIVVHTAVAHVHAIDDGITKRSAALDDPPTHERM